VTRRVGATLGLAASLWPMAACADLWSFTGDVDGRIEISDNIALAERPAGSVSTLSISARNVAAWRTESAATRLSADLTAVQQRGPGAADRIDGRLALNQTIDDPRNTVALSASLDQDFNSELSNADVTQGRGQRRAATLSAAWSHALSERLSATVQVAATNTRYDRTLDEASDFRNQSLTGSVRWHLDEITTVTAQIGHSQYRTDRGDNASTTDNIDFGLSRSLSERSVISASLGAYQTRSRDSFLVLVCPLQSRLCESGLVSYVISQRTVRDTRSGAQFSVTAGYQPDEVSKASFNVERKIAPSGASAVVRSDTLSLALSRSWSPTVNAALNYAIARSSPTAGGQRAGQQSLEVTVSRQLSPGLSAAVGARRSLADRLSGGGRPAATSLYASLKYDWARLEVSR
jgi:hypothetical protein